MYNNIITLKKYNNFIRLEKINDKKHDKIHSGGAYISLSRGGGSSRGRGQLPQQLQKPSRELPPRELPLSLIIDLKTELELDQYNPEFKVSKIDTSMNEFITLNSELFINMLKENKEQVSILIDDKVIKLIEKLIPIFITKFSEANFLIKYMNDDGSIDINGYIQRLIKKRPYVFYTGNDKGFLRDGRPNNSHDFKKFNEDYICYHEIQIAALLSVGGPTLFLNNGYRENRGIINTNLDHELWGIYVGCVGARFEIPDVMEFQHMCITKEQNTIKKGYGKLRKDEILDAWAEFYGIDYFPTYSDIKNNPLDKYIKIDIYRFLNKEIYKERMKHTIKPFLLYANQCAKELRIKGYVHIVGLGLGVWEISEKQYDIQAEVYNDVINNNDLSHLLCIDFSWMDDMKEPFYYINGENISKPLKIKGINIIFSNRNPAEKLENEYKDCLLIAMYAWDGNSFPGNEFWGGSLSLSGDPAAASCSYISYLHNTVANKSEFKPFITKH